MDDLYRTILDTTHRFRAEHGLRGLDPTGVRVHPHVTFELMTAAANLPLWLNPADRHAPDRVFGLTVITDPHLPDGVIRLVDDHGRLLHDSRSGKRVPK